MASPANRAVISPPNQSGIPNHHRGQALRLAWPLLLALMLVGCDSTETPTRVESVETNANQRVERGLRGGRLVNERANVSLGLRGNWRMVPGNTLHPTAELQAYNPAKEIYVVVLGENKASVSAPDDLNQQAQIYLQLLKGGLDRLIAEANPTEVNTIYDFDAVQYNVQGEVYGTEVTYLHTTVETNERYYQVVAWTPSRLYNENVDEMQAIIQGLRPNE